MNILFACTSTNNVATMWGSLQMLGDHSVVVFPYDRKYYEALGQVRQTNPGEYDAICKGQLAWNPSRDRIAMDRELIMECKIGKPDVIVYVSAWQGPFVPLNDTIEEMNKIAPVIHLLNDGQDPPWFKGDENRPGQLYEFDRRGQFSLTVNIDGGRRWHAARGLSQGILCYGSARHWQTRGGQFRPWSPALSMVRLPREASLRENAA